MKISMLVCLLMAASAVQAADVVNKCVDANGKLHFMDEPCPPGQLATQPETPRIGEGPALEGDKPPKADKPQNEIKQPNRLPPDAKKAPPAPAKN